MSSMGISNISLAEEMCVQLIHSGKMENVSSCFSERVALRKSGYTQ